jgi:hypothetical protein
MKDNDGNVIPGNWGTLDIGNSNNSTSDLSNQILYGLLQIDLNKLYSEGRIPQDDYIDSRQSWYGNGDPGLSVGMKSAIESTHGKTRLIPVYDSISPFPPPSGNNVEIHVVGWAVAEVVDSRWQGNPKYVRIKKSFAYDGLLKPQRDLSITDGVIEGAFTSPVLVQ